MYNSLYDVFVFCILSGSISLCYVSKLVKLVGVRRSPQYGKFQQVLELWKKMIGIYLQIAPYAGSQLNWVDFRYFIIPMVRGPN